MLQILRRPLPIPNGGEVLIQVACAGINRHDCNQRRRGHGPASATDVLGLEISGSVVATGTNVDEGLIGQKVCALVDGGGYADFVCADAALLLPWHDGLDAAEAAALPEAIFTLQLNLVEMAGLASGQWLLAHGGGSGIGTTAVPFAHVLGARVAVTAGSDEKCARARRRGADLAINYRSEDFVARMLEATEGRGANVILDCVGGSYAARNVATLAQGGTLLHLSPAGPDFSVPLREIMVRRANITGAFLRALPAPRKARLANDIRSTVWPLTAGPFRPVVDRVLPLAEAHAAHAAIEASAHFGKIVLDCRL